MNRKGSITLIVMGLVIVILLFLGGGYYLIFRQNKTHSNNIVPTPTTSSAILKSNWKTYINQKMGISLEYPPDFELEGPDTSSTSSSIAIYEPGTFPSPTYALAVNFYEKTDSAYSPKADNIKNLSNNPIYKLSYPNIAGIKALRFDPDIDYIKNSKTLIPGFLNFPCGHSIQIYTSLPNGILEIFTCSWSKDPTIEKIVETITSI